VFIYVNVKSINLTYNNKCEPGRLFRKAMKNICVNSFLNDE